MQIKRIFSKIFIYFEDFLGHLTSHEAVIYPVLCSGGFIRYLWCGLTYDYWTAEKNKNTPPGHCIWSTVSLKFHNKKEIPWCIPYLNLNFYRQIKTYMRWKTTFKYHEEVNPSINGRPSDPRELYIVWHINTIWHNKNHRSQVWVPREFNFPLLKDFAPNLTIS